MPRMSQDERAEYIRRVVQMRDEEGETFERIAERLGFERRQQARLLYRAHWQAIYDNEAIAYAMHGLIPARYSSLISKRCEQKLRRECPAVVFAEIDAERRFEVIRQADDEQTEADVIQRLIDGDRQ